MTRPNARHKTLRIVNAMGLALAGLTASNAWSQAVCTTNAITLVVTCFAGGGTGSGGNTTTTPNTNTNSSASSTNTNTSANTSATSSASSNVTTIQNYQSAYTSSATPRLVSTSQVSSIAGIATSRAFGGVGGPARSAGLPAQTGLAGSANDRRWTAWATALSNSNGYSFAPLASSGTSNSLLAGADYRFSNGGIAGVALGSDSSNVTTSFNNGSIGSSGTTVAPYFMVPVAPNWLIDGSLGFGTGNINANLGGGVTGSTKEQRSFAALGLTHLMARGAWQMQGNVQMLTTSNKAERFTLSNANVVNESTNGVTQLRTGFRASYGSGMWVPFGGLSYSHDLSRPEIAPINGQVAANARGAFTLQAGVNINQAGPLSGRLAVTQELRQETRNTGLIATVSMKF